MKHLHFGLLGLLIIVTPVGRAEDWMQFFAGRQTLLGASKDKGLPTEMVRDREMSFGKPSSPVLAIPAPSLSAIPCT